MTALKPASINLALFLLLSFLPSKSYSLECINSKSLPDIPTEADQPSDLAIGPNGQTYVVDGVTPARVRPILEAAMARFRQFKALAEELQRTRSQLIERKVVERAKGIVMAQRGLSEDAAYKLMRKTAMDRNKHMVDIADSIISASDLLGAPAKVNQSMPA